MQGGRASQLRAFVLLVLVCQVMAACFVENCAPGGKKRSSDGGSDVVLEKPGENLESASTQVPSGGNLCFPCGQGGRGRCFGRHICCHAESGCLISGSSLETLACRRLPSNSLGCGARAPSCQKGLGRCAANGVCCSADSCKASNECNNLSVGI